MSKWKAFGFQHAWSNGKGSVWTEDDGLDGAWTLKCSGDYCDDRSVAPELGDSFRTPRQAMKALDAHVAEHHKSKRR